MSVKTKNRLVLVSFALVPALVLTGCGGSKDSKDSTKSKGQSSESPSASVSVPSGVSLTKAGSELSFGDAGVVAHEANPEKKSVLSITVDSVKQGTMADFGAYQLDERAAASTPYYVRATVTNLGDGDLGGIGVPLLALDGRNTLVQASSFTNTFAPCPSVPLPQAFATDASTSTCLTFLLPDQGTLKAVSYRPSQDQEAVTWTGTVTPPKQAGKKRPGKQKNQPGKKAGTPAPAPAG